MITPPKLPGSELSLPLSGKARACHQLSQMTEAAR